MLLKCKLKYYRISECPGLCCTSSGHGFTMRFRSTAKVLLKCKLKYYRISECGLCLVCGQQLGSRRPANTFKSNLVFSARSCARGLLCSTKGGGRDVSLL